ncbi:Uncharacterized protein At4g15970 [Linum perenne]
MRLVDGDLPGGGNARSNVLRWFNLEILVVVVFLVAAGLCFLSVDYSPLVSNGYRILRRQHSSPASSPETTHLNPVKNDPELIKVLERASMSSEEQPTTSRGTVIITAVNEAWTKSNSLLHIFLESFRFGNGTQELIKHLVIVTMDQKAHENCIEVHPHCYALTTPDVEFGGASSYMSDVYLLMMWRRLEFFGFVLDLGYDFVFTDADILWFRNPFPNFNKEADFEVSADRNKGTSPDRNDDPSCGFMFFRSNIRTLKFHKFWYESRFRFEDGDKLHDQHVFDRIKFDPFLDEIGLRIRSLDTDYFGGNCSPVRDLNLACTMHANCLIGLETKLRYLRMVLGDWKHFATLPAESRNSTSYSWMRH